MRAFRPVVTAGAILLLLVLGVNPVLACEFPTPPPPAEAAEESDAVFVGTVTGIGSAGVDVVATFEVERVWRGPSTATIQVATPENPGICGYAFEVDRSYLVYANERDGELQTSIATRTTALEGAEEDLRELGEGGAPATDEGRALWPASIVVVIVVLALVATVLVRRSYRSEADDR